MTYEQWIILYEHAKNANDEFGMNELGDDYPHYYNKYCGLSKHHKEFFELAKDYYDDLNDLCVRMDETEGETIQFEEQDRLALHMILDAIDQIDDEPFWKFVNKKEDK